MSVPRHFIWCGSSQIMLPLSWFALALLLAGCQTVPPLPPADVTQPGWIMRHGQAVWKPPGRDIELAGDLVVATGARGDSFVQFTKTPVPIVVARTTPRAWEIEFVPAKRRLSGRGNPPARFIWLHLGSILNGTNLPPRHWTVERLEDDRWRFENRRTGETLEGFLAP